VPMYHNIPTHPEGISGKNMINQLRNSIALHTNYASIDDFVTIETITKDNDLFVLKGTRQPTKVERTYVSRVVVLATGAVDKQPIIGGELGTVFPYANSQLLCYCILCDGHLANGKYVAVIGNGKTTVLTALDLVHFKPKKVTILTHGKGLFDNRGEFKETEDLKRQLSTASVDVVTEEMKSLFGVKENLFGVRLANGGEMIFDIAFSAMGFYKKNNDLAIMLGGEIDKTGDVVVDGDCRVLDKGDNPIPGFYAVGDVTQNWKQLMTGFGDADRAIIHAWANYL
jgi:thioredoxin reductase (NADPH)